MPENVRDFPQFHGNRIRMLRYSVLAVLVAFSVESMAIDLWPDFKIYSLIGGEPTSIENYTYQVNILINGTQKCGGSIISHRWIITAGHCVKNTSNEYTVRLGSTFRESGGTVHSIDEVVVHEDYQENDLMISSNDIAALKVSTPIFFDGFRNSIPLFDANEEVEPGVDAVVTGWGRFSLDNDTLPSVLQTLTVSIVSKAACNASYATFGGIPDGQICAGYPEGGKDACQNDSGSPLVIDGRLAGLVSWGNGCAQPRYPGVYTEVAWYRDWIKNKTGV